MFDAEDDAVLEGLAGEPVVSVVSAGADVVDLVALSSPQHLQAILDARPGELGVLVNVTMSCLGDLAWRDRWARVLGRSGVTALIDLVPLRQFDAWRDDGSVLRYELATVAGGRAGAALFACELDGGGLRLLLPCTPVTADVLAEYLLRHYPRAVRAAEVLDGVQDLVGLTVSHLMSIDHLFDVAAYYTARGGATGA